MRRGSSTDQKNSSASNQRACFDDVKDPDLEEAVSGLARDPATSGSIPV